jgi:4-amino-4-deoxy-L-arabinose transferase-like glycosyltransferase
LTVRVAGIAVALFLASATLYRVELDRPIGNSDEAVYAQMAREMAQGGDLLTLRWQGRAVFSRPPLSVWPLAAGALAGGPVPTALAIRWPLALEAAAAVVFLFLLGLFRYGLGTGVVSALLLLFAERFIHYARFLESEPLLIAFCLLGALCWELSRSRPAWIYGYGLCLCGALLTKQIVGALPLVMPLADLCERRPLPRRELWGVFFGTVTIVGGWLAVELVRFGAPFADALLLRNVALRSLEPFHGTTTAAYYLLMMWEREGPLVIVLFLGVLYAAWRKDALPLLWTAAVLVPFSLARSRYDYYALLGYPALLLGAGRLCTSLWRGIPAPVFLLFWGGMHLYAMLARPIEVEDPETGELAQRMAAQSSADDVLFVVDQVPYSARYYSQRRTLQLLFDPVEYRETKLLLSAEVELVAEKEVGQTTRRFARWFAIVPKVDRARLGDVGKVEIVGETPRYVLLRSSSY